MRCWARNYRSQWNLLKNCRDFGEHCALTCSKSNESQEFVQVQVKKCIQKGRTTWNIPEIDLFSYYFTIYVSAFLPKATKPTGFQRFFILWSNSSETIEKISAFGAALRALGLLAKLDVHLLVILWYAEKTCASPNWGRRSPRSFCFKYLQVFFVQTKLTESRELAFNQACKIIQGSSSATRAPSLKSVFTAWLLLLTRVRAFASAAHVAVCSSAFNILESSFA